MKDTIQFLTSEISRHDQLYYVACAPEISDQQYDAMFAKLVCLEAEHPEHAHPNSPTARIGSNITNNFRKYQHPVPMLSIKSFYSESELIEAITKTNSRDRVRPVSGYSIETKLDGISIELEYRNGQLFRALTRGNAIEGEDVTDNIRTIKSIPLVIARHEAIPSFIVRGEIVITEQGLKEVNKLRRKNKLEPYPTQRNAAASLLMIKSSGECAEAACQSLKGVFYTIVDAFSQEVTFAKLSRMGFLLPSFTTIESIDQLPDAISSLQSSVSILHYPSDGIVVKANYLDDQTRLGETSRHVNWAWALKELSETIQSPFRYIDYSISANGTITPIIHFQPVNHNGINYQCAKVTWSNLEAWKLSKGDVLNISIKGSVSASVFGVIKHGSDTISLPASCPCCKSPFPLPEQRSGSKDGVGLYRCTNPLCPEKTGDWQTLSGKYKIFDAGNQNGTIAKLRWAASQYNAPVVRKAKGTSQTLIFYQSIDSLSHIIFNAAQLKNR